MVVVLRGKYQSREYECLQILGVHVFKVTTPNWFTASAITFRITCLNHKSFYDTMEYDTTVDPFCRQNWRWPLPLAVTLKVAPSEAGSEKLLLVVDAATAEGRLWTTHTCVNRDLCIKLRSFIAGIQNHTSMHHFSYHLLLHQLDPTHWMCSDQEWHNNEICGQYLMNNFHW